MTAATYLRMLERDEGDMLPQIKKMEKFFSNLARLQRTRPGRAPTRFIYIDERMLDDPTLGCCNVVPAAHCTTRWEAGKTGRPTAWEPAGR